jgi:uncharacterized protein YukE
MSQIRIDPEAIRTAEQALALAETEETETRKVVNELETRRSTIQWAHQVAGHEHHSSTSASGLYMTGYGTSRRHMERCNQNMDRKESIDRTFEENMADVRRELVTAERAHDRAVEKVRQAKEDLRRAERGF